MDIQNEHGERRVYAPKELMELFGLSKAAVYQGIERGEIPSIRIGRRILVPKDAVDRLLNGKAA